MLKKVFTFAILIGFSVISLAQRFGYVDTEYVLNSLPQYAEAQKRVDMQAENWAKEIANYQEQLERELASFEEEKILLTPEQIDLKEKSLTELREKIDKLKEEKYGPTGALLSLRQSAVKPIQDQLWNVIKQVAERRNYSFVFDKGSDLVMLYSDPKYDISEEVLRKLLPEGKNAVRGGKDEVNKRNQDTNRRNVQKRVNN